MTTDKENTTPDASESWYSERQARIESERARIDAQTNLLETTYGNLRSRWAALDQQENAAHDELDTRQIVAIQNERQKLQADAGQLQNGWQALQQEKQQIERISNLDYNTLLEGSREKSQMFLRAWRSKFENDPASLRKLLYADSQIKASGITPDSRGYFESLEQRLELPAAERAREFESRTKRKEAKLTADELETAHSIGVDPEEYMKAAQKTYSFDAKSDDSHTYLDPGSMVDTGKSEDNGPEIHFEKPKTREVKLPYPGYRPWKNSVTLSQDEVDLCKHMAVSTNLREKEVIREFAENKIALHRGESHYRLADEKKRSSTPSKHF
jgi:hypothetical protein